MISLASIFLFDYYSHMTRKASISILKAQLSRYLDAVKAGEEIIVTERGRPIARLSTIEHSEDPSGRVAQLVREGRLRPPSHALPEVFEHACRLSDPTGRALHTLLEERREGR